MTARFCARTSSGRPGTSSHRPTSGGSSRCRRHASTRPAGPSTAAPNWTGGCLDAVTACSNVRRRHRYLTRAEIARRSRGAGFTPSGIRLAYIVMHAELEGLICSGPRRGKEFTYALLDERAPGGRALPREEALAELTRRSSRATDRRPCATSPGGRGSPSRREDGNRGDRARRQVRDARRPHLLVRRHTGARAPKGALVHLLPNYDEYLIASQGSWAGQGHAQRVRDADRRVRALHDREWPVRAVTNQRGSDDVTGHLMGDERALQLESARAGLVAALDRTLAA